MLSQDLENMELTRVTVWRYFARMHFAPANSCCCCGDPMLSERERAIEHVI